jgi:hypothetical protein
LDFTETNVVGTPTDREVSQTFNEHA